MDKELSDLIDEWKGCTLNKLIIREDDYALLKNLASFARHSTYCKAVLDNTADCDCGFREAYIKWTNR